MGAFAGGPVSSAAFLRNPEFIRYVRAELRPARALSTGLVVLVICFLVGLICWAAEHDNFRQFLRLYYGWLLGMQFVVLGLWSLSTCGQAISRERELKTYDFQRTTRLKPWELMVGKVLGAPVLGYFAVAASLPVSLVAGLLGEFSPRVLFETYLLLAVLALFLGLVGLWLSMLVERASSALGLLVAMAMGMAFGLWYSPFPGFGAISMLPAIFSLYSLFPDPDRVTATLFGTPVSPAALTLVLYVTFGAWLVLMLTRNLKKDVQQIRLLSRLQAIGFAAYLNALFYAFLEPIRLTGGTLRPQDVATAAVVLNAAILWLIGLAMLTPREKLKVWWRKHSAREARYLSEDGPLWPWLAAAACVIYALLVAAAMGYARHVPLGRWRLATAALELLALLVFITRDVLFLQWCALTQMKRPLFKGFLYLCLYYAAVGIVAGVAGVASGTGIEESSVTAPRVVVSLLTPWMVFIPRDVGLLAAPEIYLGIALQIGALFALERAITGRLSRPAVVVAAPAAGHG